MATSPFGAASSGPCTLCSLPSVSRVRLDPGNHTRSGSSADWFGLPYHSPRPTLWTDLPSWTRPSSTLMTSSTSASLTPPPGNALAHRSASLSWVRKVEVAAAISSERVCARVEEEVVGEAVAVVSSNESRCLSVGRSDVGAEVGGVEDIRRTEMWIRQVSGRGAEEVVMAGGEGTRGG